MTDEEARRIVLILTMNYAAFMPPEPTSAAAKQGMWVKILRPYDYKTAIDATQDFLKKSKFPPTIADFCEYFGASEATAEDLAARLPGPTEAEIMAGYTADMERVAAKLKALDQELARIPAFGK